MTRQLCFHDLYSVGTWDTEAQAYTPQAGMKPSFNLTLTELRIQAAVRPTAVCPLQGAPRSEDSRRLADWPCHKGRARGLRL